MERLLLSYYVVLYYTQYIFMYTRNIFHLTWYILHDMQCISYNRSWLFNNMKSTSMKIQQNNHYRVCKQRHRQYKQHYMQSILQYVWWYFFHLSQCVQATLLKIIILSFIKIFYSVALTSSDAYLLYYRKYLKMCLGYHFMVMFPH